MQVFLRVVGGKNDGREITISVPDFYIGRGEQAQLRPSSDLISRMHCAIRVQEGQVIIEDLGSRNGTFVNTKQLTGTHVAKSGDRLRVGRLQFELVIDPSKPSSKKPKVNNVVEAASRTVEKESKPAESIEDSITDWLSDPDLDGYDRKNQRNMETIQFSMEDTSSFGSKPDSDEEASEGDSSDSVDEEDIEDEDDDPKSKKKKKGFGKLPPLPKFSHDNSTSAAGDVLKKFFNRR